MDNMDLFIHHSNFDERMEDFHQKLKKHLMDEYLYLSEKKDNLEAEAIQIRMEMDQKDKALFPNMEKGDVRKYFSPLSISGIKEKQKDEKEKLMNTNYSRIQDEMNLLETRMKEIMDFLRDVDNLLEKDREAVESDSDLTDSDVDEKLYDDYDSEAVTEEETEEELNEKYIDNNEYEKQDKLNIQIYQYEYFNSYSVYPQMIRNLYNIADFCRSKDHHPEVLIEFNDHNIELDLSVNEMLIKQILYNIECAVKDNEADIDGLSDGKEKDERAKVENSAMILIEGSIDESSIVIGLNYISENESIDTVKISYEISRN